MSLRSKAMRSAVAAIVVAITVGFAAPASAKSDYSRSVTYPNGASLRSYAYISGYSDREGCGDYNTWAKISRRPSWIRLQSHFTRIGFGSFTVGGVTGSESGSDVTLRWTNTNGARGSYLSGNVCVSWSVIYLHLQATGASLQYGTVRTVSTKVL